MGQSADLVREWFLSNGRQLANCAAVGPPPMLRDGLRACSAVVRSIRFG